MATHIQCTTSEIGSYFRERMLEDIDSPDSKVHRIVKAKFQLVALLASFLANPILMPPSPVKGRNLVYDIFLRGSQTIGFSFLSFWASCRILDQMVEPMGKREWKIVDMKRQIGPKIALLIGAVSLGIFVRMGAAALQYYSNDKDLYTPITNLVIDSSIPAYSSMVVLQFLGTEVWNATRTSKEKAIITMRDRLIAVLEDKIDRIPRMTKHDRDAFGESLMDVCQKEPQDCVAMAMEMPKEMALAYPKREWANIPGYVIGGVTALSVVCGLGYMGSLGFEKAGADQYLAIGLGVATSMIFAQVLGSLIPKQTARLLRTFTYVGFEPDLTDAALPKMSAIFKSALLATTPLVWGSAVDAANAYFTGFLQTAAKVTWAAAILAIVTRPLFDFQNEISERVAAKRLGTDQEKAVVSYTMKMRKLINVLKAAPLHKVAAFIKELPDRTWDHVVDNALLTRDALDFYVNKRSYTTQLMV